MLHQCSVPNGGYVLGVVVDAVIQHQSTTNQPDPIHLSAHYLQPSVPGPCEVQIRIQRIRRRYSNITADLYQKGNMNVTTHIIVGTLPDVNSLKIERATPTILPPHPLATRIPFYTHTALSKYTGKPSKLTFKNAFEQSKDPVVFEMQNKKSLGGTNGGLESSAWLELTEEPDKTTRLGLPAITFLADLGKNPPSILPRDEQPGESWFPTMSFQIEFKVKLSTLPDYIAPQTFGLWSYGRFLVEGRHELHTEVWTAPSAIGKPGAVAADDPNWRDKMFCVARSAQMALTIPIEVNRRKAAKGKEGVKL
ncbi:hypothetical protein DL93DRAFT_2078128 [Clavulina sp. PMI_390]|nr:hypothetical protein DL93DRAFT_2078128 [Clavulina sp. PMI_390]